MEQIKNCTEEAIIRIIGKMTLEFDTFQDLEKQRQLKSVLEESLYGYDVITQSKELICSDIEEKVQIYLMTRSIEGISKSTLYNYNLILHKFMDFFSTKTVSMIKTMDIQFFLANYKKEHNVKNSTLNGIIFCLKKFFSWLEESEYIIKNPMKQVKEIKVEKRLKQVMSDAEVELLRDSCKDIREQLLINFSLDTGCRVSEIVGVNISNINMDKLSCTVIGKGNKQRYVYFTEKTKLLITKYLKDRKEFDEHEALILGTKFPYKRIGSRSMQVMINKIKDRASLSDKEYITMHSCRKYLGSRLINKGVSLESVRKILGHSNPSTTLIYAQMKDETVQNSYRIGI